MGMLFVRCAGGISHHPDEAVTEPDVAAMLDALEAAVVAVLDGHGATAG
jgi:allantoate deiminase